MGDDAGHVGQALVVRGLSEVLKSSVFKQITDWASLGQAMGTEMDVILALPLKVNFGACDVER